MKNRSLALALVACATLAACDRSGQPLPFDTGSTEPVTRTIPAQGATVSSAAGASVQLPAGAVPAGTQVTLTPMAAQSSASGTAAAPYAFALQPAGLALAAPAAVDLRVHRGAPDAWLASVVVAPPGGVVESGGGTVDLNGGLLHGEIAALGTVTAVIPPAAAVVRARPLGSALRALSPASNPATATVTTRALRGTCGSPQNRCQDLVVEVSESLLGLVDTAAVLFPRVGGQLTFNGTGASGSLQVQTPLRVRLGTATATTVDSRVTATATPQTVVAETAGRITLTNMRVVGESGPERGETLATLVVEYEGARAWVRVEHQFESVVQGGRREMVTVAARVPLDRVQ